MSRRTVFAALVLAFALVAAFGGSCKEAPTATGRRRRAERPWGAETWPG